MGLGVLRGLNFCLADVGASPQRQQHRREFPFSLRRCRFDERVDTSTRFVKFWQVKVAGQHEPAPQRFVLASVFLIDVGEMSR